MRSTALRAASKRVGVLRAVFLGVFLVLAVRAAHLTVVDSRAFAHGEGQVHTVFRLPPSRGLILDRNGVELAVTIHSPSVYVIPDAFKSSERTVRNLASALDLNRHTLAKRLRKRKRFTFVARWVTANQAERVQKLELPGVGIVSEPRRAYPAGALGAGMLGFANIDGEGVRGVEQQEDDWLRGAPRSLPVERDARGRLLSQATLEPREAAGGDIALTLHAGLQAEAESALRAAVKESGAVGGVVVSLDPHSGEILALAEEPGFDPNRFREVDYASTRSRAFLDAFEPGSVMKAFLVAGALEEGAVQADDVIDCGDGWMRVPGKTIRDARAYGPLDITGVLRVSSNVGAVQIARELGSRDHHEALMRFGFGQPTGTGFPFESAGLLRAWKGWQPVDHATIAFGHGLNVTPIQLAAATAALANGGEWVRPRLIRARRRPEGEWRYTSVDRVRRVISPETSSTVLGMLETVVGSAGTGRLAGLRGVRVAGKTGTAQKLDAETGTYSSDRFVASFLGAVPADDPKLVIVAILDEPSGRMHSGGTVAAPLFSKVAAAQLAHLGILTAPEAAPKSRPIPVVTAAVSTSPAAAPALAEVAIARDGNRLLLPDFRGLSVTQVRRIAAHSPIRLEVRGHGRAVAQDPAPGTILAGRERRVRVDFSPGTGEG